jgi:hypothetical protein
MVDRAASMVENGSLTLAVRSDGCSRRTLHGIYGVVDRVQGSTGFLDCFGRHSPLHSTAGVYGTANTPRYEQSREEAHLYLQATKPAALEDYSYTHACAGMACWPDTLTARRIRDAAVTHQTPPPRICPPGTARRLQCPRGRALTAACECVGSLLADGLNVFSWWRSIPGRSYKFEECQCSAVW